MLNDPNHGVREASISCIEVCNTYGGIVFIVHTTDFSSKPELYFPLVLINMNFVIFSTVTELQKLYCSFQEFNFFFLVCVCVLGVA